MKMRFVFAAGSLLLACLSLPALAAPQHALTLYDEPPKYPADFKHFDYVNANAPKAGSARHIAIGTFDNFNLVVAGVKARSPPASISSTRRSQSARSMKYRPNMACSPKP